ncbi:hypothetical protein FOA52_002612 [Chlamydomonas sp. UWO 241]|nr:hypothetical protein FOA52_002612 [Chlamydomonas sp. UWO 241]
MTAAKLVKDTIAAHKVVMFSKSYCPYCNKAKAALATVMKAANYFVIELDKRNDGDEIQDELLKVTGGRSVPRVFIGGEFIGGGDDTARLAGTGELKALIEAAGGKADL